MHLICFYADNLLRQGTRSRSLQEIAVGLHGCVCGPTSMDAVARQRIELDLRTLEVALVVVGLP